MEHVSPSTMQVPDQIQVMRLGIKPVSCPVKTIIIAFHRLGSPGASNPTPPPQTPYRLGRTLGESPLEDQPVLLHSASF